MLELITKSIDEGRQGKAFQGELVPNNIYSKHFYIESYGCQMNLSDSEIIASILQGEGFGATRNVEEANLIFLNTKQISILADFFKVSPSFFFEDGEPIQSSESEEYFKRIQAILTDIRQISETVKQQLLCLREAWWYNKTILRHVVE